MIGFSIRALSAAVILASVVACQAKSDAESRIAGTPKSPYRGRVKSADGQPIASCDVAIQMKLPSGEWLPLNALRTTADGSFEGTVGAITSGPVEMELRLTPACTGYAPVNREVKWKISPTESKPFDVGDLVVQPAQR